VSGAALQAAPDTIQPSGHFEYQVITITILYNDVKLNKTSASLRGFETKKLSLVNPKQSE
jgi:hypothetical protein